MNRAISLLIIEDDIEYVDIIRICLEEPDSMNLKFEIERADRLSLGLKLLDAARFDAVLLDLTLPDSRGLDTIKRLLDRGYDAPVIVMTNLGDESAAFEAMGLGAQDYLIKSTSDSRLLKRAIWYAIERHKLRSQAENLIKKAAEGMIVVDAAGKMRFVNASAEQIFGRAKEELLDKPFPEPLSPSLKRQARVVCPKGLEKTVDLRVTEIEWRGKPALLVSLTDITEVQRVEQLKAEVRERRRLDQLKDDLIGTVSHELRTPLTIVKGAIDNLKEGIVGPLQPKQREVVGLADRNLFRLTKMINNLLDLSRLESGQAAAHKKACKPKALVDDVVADFRAAGRAAKKQLTSNIEPDLPEVDADPELIAEVLLNLVDNAVRFAKSRAEVKASDVGSRGVLFEVIDDGPGIPPERMGGLFNKFVQVNRPKGGEGYKGTGLGLAICKEIMALHGATIRVECPESKGCRFSFALPRYGAPRQPSKPRSAEGAKP